MSADNWAKCPRCTLRDAREIGTEQARIDAAYGTVSVDEFDAMREALAARRATHGDHNAFRTFREDYEFFGVEEGEVTASYRGGCSVCGLRLTFEHTRELDVSGGAS